MQIADLPVAEASAAMLDGTLTVQDIVGACQARCRRFNGRFRAFSHFAPENSLPVDALQAELVGGKIRGPMHGIPVTVKGNMPVASLPWTEGSATFANRIATADASIVARVRRAGGIILGTTTLSELAMYGVRNAFEPLGLNPWDEDRTAGGSSTGAGVAASLGMATINIGTDSGGSIRNPACHTGVVGFMASADTLPGGGTPTHTPSLPSLGLIARHVSDVVLAYRTLSATPISAVEPTLRLLVPRRLIEQMCDDETLALFDKALELLEHSGIVLINRDFASWRNGETAAGVISLFEGSRALDRMDYTKASEGIRLRREQGLRITEQEYVAARRATAETRCELSEALASGNADAIISPTWPFAAPLIDADSVRVRGEQVFVDPRRNIFVRAANAAAAAAVTLPMGMYPLARVPAGLHLMAAHRSDHRLLATAAHVEQALPHLPPPPPLAYAQLAASDLVGSTAP
jgi:Asp-tRNA(Asn)/Glu-tRNA(Gln) amidotransferase A subunit family amidase